jgi:hypothetical protein
MRGGAASQGGGVVRSQRAGQHDQVGDEGLADGVAQFLAVPTGGDVDAVGGRALAAQDELQQRPVLYS